MKVLVTGLFEPAAVHTIRRLGELGYEVHAADGHRLAFAGFSRHVTKRIRLPNMRYAPDQYVKKLLRVIETGGYDYYFPSYEEIILMSKHRDRILAATRSTLPEFETLMTLHDKARLAEMAKTIGIDTPENFIPGSLAEAKEYIATVDHPVVIKMRKTSGAAGFRIVHDLSQLEKLYLEVVQTNKLPESELPMIQQFIHGKTTCTLELCQAGKVLGEVMYQGIRTMPRTGGTTVFRESVADPACSVAVERIVEHLKYEGLCGFDFILDEATGRPFLVDGNCRITPAATMAYHGGCDLIEAWIRVADGQPSEPLPIPRRGVRTKMQFGDFVWLLESYIGSFKDWQGERQRRKEWWADKDFHYDISSLRDPMPIAMIWFYILTNCYKLIFTDFDSAQLFIFHNQYVESVPS